MSTTYTTQFMNLSLPIPGITKGPTWATLVNAAFQAIDQHDHSPGKGKFIPSSSIDILGNIDFGSSYGLLNSRFVQLKDLSAISFGGTGGPAVEGGLFNWKGDLWWQYSLTGNTPPATIGVQGTFVQLTSYTNPWSQTCALEPLYITGATYTIGYLEKVSYVLVTSQPTTITLPKISTLEYTAKFYLIQDKGGNASTNNITITPNAADSIGASTAGTSEVISTNYGYRWLISDGANRWLILTSA